MAQDSTSPLAQPPRPNGKSDTEGLEIADTQGHARSVLDLARRANAPAQRTISILQAGSQRAYQVTRYGWGEIPTPYGEFQQLAFRVDDQWHDYHCLVKAERWTEDFQPVFCRPDNLLLRLDSTCIGGTVFGATDCDCRAQLIKAEEEIARNGEGVIVHIGGQDGRGKGTGFKCATQILQKRLDYNTVEAARALAGGPEIDVRTYGGAVAVLKFLLGQEPVAGFALLSGNPRKAAALSENGYTTTLHPPQVVPTPLTIRHLQAKARLLYHLVPCVTL
ncbi:MAG TPA: hypothetical protein VG734_00240 [Lacunisphaera sp.]|nr:hypothetical protein [Lacunisphaera sp.]